MMDFEVTRNIILYWTTDYAMQDAGATSVHVIVRVCSAVTNFAPVFYAFLARSCAVRCRCGSIATPLFKKGTTTRLRTQEWRISRAEVYPLSKLTNGGKGVFCIIGFTIKILRDLLQEPIFHAGDLFNSFIGRSCEETWYTLLYTSIHCCTTSFVVSLAMEGLSDLENVIEEPLLSKQNSNAKGGFRTLPFIIANEAFERLASLGLMPNMILYLTRECGMQTAGATNFLLLWSAASNFTPFVGAVLSDSYVGRYSMIAFGSIASLLGMILLWLTTMIPLSKPLCNSCNNSPTTIHLMILHSSFALMSIGAGGIRSSSLAFGVDQLSKRDKDAGIKESYFSWYYAIVALSSLIGLTVVVYIQDTMGWGVGFGIPAILMFVATVSFFLASPFYVMVEVKRNMLSGLAQVLVASYKNRLLQLPQEPENGIYHIEKDSDLLMPTEKLRFLNKACMIRNPLQDLTPEGRTLNPWNLCTVEQVEELKALIKIVPIWTTGIIMGVNISQGSFLVLEASSMDRHITSNFEIPSGSFVTFMILSLVLWVIIYDRILVPVASKIKGYPTCIGAKQKIGFGLLTISIAIASLAVVENIRRKIAIEQGYEDQPQAVVNMSALWLLPRQILNGLAEALGVVGQNEFFLNELPQSMSSLASTLNGLGSSVANLIASFILSVVDNVTGGGGHESWLSSNLNKGHYDYYYTCICALSFVNFVYFLYCSKSYGPCKNREK